MTTSSRRPSSSARMRSPNPSSPYAGAVSKKLTPASSAAWTSPALSSTTPHQSVAIVQTPNPTSETSRSLVPNLRYRIADSRVVLLVLRVLDDRAGDRARAHVVEGVVHRVEGDLGRDELVEHELALAVELGERRDVAVHVRRPVPAPADLLLHDHEAERGGDVDHDVHLRHADEDGLTAAAGHVERLLDR